VLAIAQLVEGNTICEEELLDDPTNAEVQDQLCPMEALTNDGAHSSDTRSSTTFYGHGCTFAPWP
jgi:hypothetical protein